jgi:hypothetical protein
MTLGGLLKHLAFVEDFWIGMTCGGDAPARTVRLGPWDADPDWDWSSVGVGQPAAELRERWERRRRALPQ